jgi:hypothetical protein
MCVYARVKLDKIIASDTYAETSRAPDVLLGAERNDAVKMTVPRMEDIAFEKLQLSGFAEVSFEGGFIPGRLKEIWLDEGPSNMPADAVLSHERSFVVLRFR